MTPSTSELDRRVLGTMAVLHGSGLYLGFDMHPSKQPEQPKY